MIFQLSFFIYILQSFYLIGFNNLSNKLGESFNKTEGRSGELYSAIIKVKSGAVCPGSILSKRYIETFSHEQICNSQPK